MARRSTASRPAACGGPSTPGGPPVTCSSCSTRHSRTPVPQPLSYLVEDVARRHGRVRVGAAAPSCAVTTKRLSASCSPTGARVAAAAAAGADRAVGAVAARTWCSPGCARWATPRPPSRLTVTSSCAGPRRGARRGSGSRRPAVRTGQPHPAPQPALLAAAVRCAAGRRRAASTVTVGRPAADVLAMLTQAAGAGESLLIGYVDAEGRGSQRVIEPLAVEGGHVMRLRPPARRAAHASRCTASPASRWWTSNPP